MESEPLGAPPPLTDPDARLAALDGHALPGVVQVRDGRFTYWPNAGDGRWGGPVRLRDTPIVASLAETGSQLLDLDGDTQVDLLVGTAGDAPPGFYANGEGAAGTASWRIRAGAADAAVRGRSHAPRRPRRRRTGRRPVRRLRGCTRAGATKGDEGWTLAGAARLGDGQAAPDVVTSGTRSCALADMTGDGLPDLVRLRSGKRRVLAQPRQWALRRRVRDDRGTALRAQHGAGVRLRARRRRWGRLRRLVTVGGRRACGCTSTAPATASPHPVEDPLVPPPIAGTLQAADLLGHGRPGLTWAAPRGRGTGHGPLRVRRGSPLRPDRRRERRGPRVRDRVPVVRRGRAARPAGGGALDHVPAVPGPRGGRDARARRALRSRQRDPLPLPRGPLRRGRAPLRRVPARRPAGDRRRREAGRADRPSLPHRGGARAGRRARGVGTEPHCCIASRSSRRTPICRCGSRRPSTRSRSWTSCPTAGAACG